MSRYDRQILLPQIGRAGQARLAEARVLLIGCGALGTVIAAQLTRAGVGYLRIADRDIVELSNLQRQVLFDESDAQQELPKAVAAANRLRKINSTIEIDAKVVDCGSQNIEELISRRVCFSTRGVAQSSGVRPCAEAHPTSPPQKSAEEGESAKHVDLILDGTDNAETRYLINDVSVKHGIPWVYGACVGMEGRAMAVVPGATPCLRCIFPTPPAAGELPTCDTAGVFAPAAAIVASLQVAAAIKLLVRSSDSDAGLIRFDVWSGRFHRTATEQSRRPDCIACGQHRYEFLSHFGASSVSLCGRNAVQVRPPNATQLDLESMAVKLSSAGQVQRTPYLVRCQLPPPQEFKLTLFADGRLIVNGTNDLDRARSIYARYVGS